MTSRFNQPNKLPRLSAAALANYRGPAVLPDYDRGRIRPGILHIGIGAFHRAHQAAHVDACLCREPDWGIVGASLRSARTRDELAPQDGLYVLGVRDAEKLETRIVGSVIGVLAPDAGAASVIDLIAAPETRIVSLTVTEKGYCASPTSGALDDDNAQVAAELGGAPPQSVPAVLVEGLRRRRRNNAGPVTLMSCDNLQENGTFLRGVVTDFASRTRPDLARWISDEENVSFPRSMVDRITPRTTEADIAEIAAVTGLHDAWPVITEPFSDWVLEDRFVAGRPNLEAAGVRLVDDVRIHEETKLRILNGTHSMMAWIGLMLGHETVADAISDPRLAGFLDRTVASEIIPSIALPVSELVDYWARLRRRYANRALRHALGQIAMDSSQKLTPRVLATIRDRRRAGHGHDGLSLGIAAWIAHVAGARGEVSDPARGQLVRIATARLPDAKEFARDVLALESIFGRDLASDSDFRDDVEEKTLDLLTKGAASRLDEAASPRAAALHANSSRW